MTTNCCFSSLVADMAKACCISVPVCGTAAFFSTLSVQGARIAGIGFHSVTSGKMQSLASHTEEDRLSHVEGSMDYRILLSYFQPHLNQSALRLYLLFFAIDRAFVPICPCSSFCTVYPEFPGFAS